MQQIKKLLRLDKTEYYETHLSLINCLIPVKLTPMEIKVLAAFMSLEGHIAQLRFGPSAKKIVMQQCDITPAGLSNYIKSLMNKGALVKTGDVTTIIPILMPEEKEQLYLFKLQKNDENISSDSIITPTINASTKEE